MKNIISISFFMIFFSWTVGAQTGQLYGVDVQGNLFAIDVTTGAGTIVGVLPDGPWTNPELPGYNEFEFDRVNQRAWAQQRNGNFQIQEFDISSGAGIGAPIPNNASWHGMEFINGVLYAAGFAGGVGTGSLAVMDPATGVFTLIGPLNLPEGVITGLAYHEGTGVLYGINGGGGGGGESDIAESALFTIDMSTAAVTLVGMCAMTAGSLEFGPDGNLYAGGVGANQGNLFRIDQMTGFGTLVGATGFGTGPQNGLGGLALVGQNIAIPTFSQWGILIFIALLGIAAVWMFRRSSTQA